MFYLPLLFFSTAAAVAVADSRRRRRSDANVQRYLPSLPCRVLVVLAGFLVSVDTYMNLLLASTEEYVDGEFAGNLGDVLIRCNNVLYLRGAEEDEANAKAGDGGGANGMDEEEDEG